MAGGGTNHKGWPKGKKRGPRGPWSEEIRAKISLGNKGKCTGRKLSPELKAKMSESQKKRHEVSPFSISSLAKIRKANQKKWRDPEFRKRQKQGCLKAAMVRESWPFSGRGKICHLGKQTFRSTWELSFAKRLNELGLSWLYEKKRFRLSSGKIYIPDFLLIESGWLVEIKGLWTEQALKKVSEFREEYPLEKLIVLETIKEIECWQWPEGEELC